MKVLLVLLPVLLALSGCSNIRSKQLVGKEPVDLSGTTGEVDLSGIAGEWVNSDGEMTSVTVTNAKEGEVRYAPLEPDDGDEPVTLKLRKSEDHVFINFPKDEDGERVWLLMKVNGDMNEILVWEPATELFRKLIAEGKIKGKNDPETVKNEEGEDVRNRNPGAVIDDPDGAWVEKMVAGEFGVIVDWQNPTVLRRRVSEEDNGAGENETAAETKAVESEDPRGTEAGALPDGE